MWIACGLMLTTKYARKSTKSFSRIHTTSFYSFLILKKKKEKNNIMIR